MRWMLMTPLCCLLSACIFVEGQIIQEPKDIVIPASAYQFPLKYPCHSLDVTQAECMDHHCGHTFPAQVAFE